LIRKLTNYSVKLFLLCDRFFIDGVTFSGSGCPFFAVALSKKDLKSAVALPLFLLMLQTSLGIYKIKKCSLHHCLCSIVTNSRELK